MTKQLLICVNHRKNPAKPSCGARGSPTIATYLENIISANQLPIELVRMPCLGECERGPNARLSPNGEFFHAIKQDSIETLIEEVRQFCQKA